MFHLWTCWEFTQSHWIVNQDIKQFWTKCWSWGDTGSQWPVAGSHTAKENHLSPAVQILTHPSHLFIQSISHRSGCKLGRIVRSKPLLTALSHVLVTAVAGSGFQEDFLHLPGNWNETDGFLLPWIFLLEDECDVCLSVVIRNLPWSL